MRQEIKPEQEIKLEQETKPEQEALLKSATSQTYKQESRETRRKYKIKGVENKKGFLERSICILAIISVLVCQDALSSILGVWWMALPVALAIHSIYLVFLHFQKQYIMKILLFTLSCCILYVGLVQVNTIAASYEVQIILNTDDERCCNVLKMMVHEKKVQQEANVKQYIEDIQRKIEEGLNEDVAREQLLQYIGLLKKQLNIVADEKTVQETIDNIYQIMAEAKAFIGDEVFQNYGNVQKSILQLIRLKQVEADILELSENKEIKINTVVNEEAWIKRIGDIVYCKKELEMFDKNSDIIEAYGQNESQDLDEIIANMEQQLKANVLNLKEFGQCIGLLFKPQSPCWGRLLSCAIAAFIINGLEVISVNALVKMRD